MSTALGWWREGTPEGRRAVLAAGLGWMLDAFDVTLFALVLPVTNPQVPTRTVVQMVVIPRVQTVVHLVRVPAGVNDLLALLAQAKLVIKAKVPSLGNRMA